jgi:hypothetical protein
LDRPEAIKAWLEHTDPAKRDRYEESLAIVEHSPLYPNSKKVRNVQINVKKDEVLLKYRLEEEDNGMIPRPIHNVDPQLAVTIGPDVYAASEVLKRAWSWKTEPHRRVWHVPGRNITLTYGAGLLADELDAWFHHAITTDGWHILVAGDDSVVIYRAEGKLWIIEGDISKCDHSVRRMALDFEYRQLIAAGMDPQVADFLLSNSGAVCVAGARGADGGTIRVNRQPERNTGGVDTTVGNTIITGGIHLFACASCRPTSERVLAAWFKEAFAGAGFALKARVWSGPIGDLGHTYFGPSFLKGYWYPSDSEFGWSWGPLPSRMLKISKIMTDPVRVYHLPGEGKISYELAAARHVAGLYLGLRPHTWPSELLEWLHARADPAWSKRVAIEEWTAAWRPRAGHGAAPRVREEWRLQAAWWYGVPVEQVEDWLSQLARLQLLEFSFHPFWAQMALKDYN